MLNTARRIARRFLRPVEPVFPTHPTLDDLNRRLGELRVPPLHPDPEDVPGGAVGAARYVLGTLLADPRHRRRYPAALAPGGAFARRVAAGLPPSSAAVVAAVFADNPGRAVARVYELRADLREAFVLGLTPHQRDQYLAWLLTYGRADFGFTPEQVLWYLCDLADDPSRGLVASYRLHPRWQSAVPHGLTRFGWPALKAWLAVEYGLDAEWFRRATLPKQYGPWDEVLFLRHAFPDSPYPAGGDAAAVAAWVEALPGLPRPGTDWKTELAAEFARGVPDALGTNVIGLFRYTSGLQQAALGAVDSLGRAGVRTVLRDLPVLSLRESREAPAYNALEQFDVTLLNTGLDFAAADVYRQTGLHPRPGAYRIGMWWWEMEQLPTAWLGRGDEVDEIWAPTRFIADAMRGAFRKPVFPMLPGLELPAFEPLGKEYFGLRPGRFAFAFIFDMNSRLHRKNPLGLLRAFRRAFAPTDPVDLVLKVSPPETFYREHWEVLRAEAAAVGAVLIERILTRGEILGLLAAADAYVSLHRSEGFGLTCAEAMLLGKPVVATGYSGNLDFMTPENSYLVGYDRVALAEECDPYPKGSIWAEPHTDHAAELMRQVVENPAEAAAKGLRAKAELEQLLAPAAAGRRMAARLAEVRAAREGLR